MKPEELAKAWLEYREMVPLNEEPKTAKAKQMRDDFILNYVYLTNRVANKMGRNLPNHVDNDDLESYAKLGLIRAISRFDPTMGVPFESYALTNMRSMILDGIRALDWAPRSLRKAERELHKAREAVQQEIGREPNYSDVAKQLGTTTSEVIETARKAHNAGFASIHVEEDSLAVSKANTNTEESAMAGQMQKAIAKAYAHLPFKEAVVVALYYYQEKKLGEIAKFLGISEVKAGAIHTEAVMKIWRSLEGLRIVE